MNRKIQRKAHAKKIESVIGKYNANNKLEKNIEILSLIMYENKHEMNVKDNLIQLCSY